jgi:hypothetical protein
MHYKDIQNKLHFLDSAEFEYLLPEGCVQITEDEAEALRPKHIPTYADLRAQAYPPINDQLDSIFHNGLDGWKATIQDVKDKYPKEVV